MSQQYSNVQVKRGEPKVTVTQGPIKTKTTQYSSSKRTTNVLPEKVTTIGRSGQRSIVTSKMGQIQDQKQGSYHRSYEEGRAHVEEGGYNTTEYTTDGGVKTTSYKEKKTTYKSDGNNLSGVQT